MPSSLLGGPKTPPKWPALPSASHEADAQVAWSCVRPGGEGEAMKGELWKWFLLFFGGFVLNKDDFCGVFFLWMFVVALKRGLQGFMRVLYFWCKSMKSYLIT